jgi:hypothetical protein
MLSTQLDVALNSVHPSAPSLIQCTSTPELLDGHTMCLVQSPYFRLCGHYGRYVVAPSGRCARAEHISGPCWEPEDIGIRTIESMCVNCERTITIPETHQPDPSRVGPVDCDKFNLLVKLHKQTCDRRYSSFLSTLSLSSTDNGDSTSEVSVSSSTTSTALLQTADELALRRPSTASEHSIVSTSANNTMSIRVQSTNPFV